MAPKFWFILLIVGAVLGWLTSKYADKGGLGLGGDVVVGIVGAFAGNWLMNKFGVHLGGGTYGFIAAAAIGAILLLVLLRVVRRL